MTILALSSGESELAGVCRAGTESLGMQSVLRDFDQETTIRIKSDATAAIGMVHRLGLGRVRHLATGDLWMQQHVREGRISICKVLGTENPADAFTKHMHGPDIHAKLKRLNWEFPGV